jgi:hypothetical protein
LDFDLSFSPGFNRVKSSPLDILATVSTVSSVGLDEKPLKRLKEILKANRTHPVETG